MYSLKKVKDNLKLNDSIDFDIFLWLLNENRKNLNVNL